MKSLFEVGEIAIIQSKNHPEYNGKETLILTKEYNRAARCSVTGTISEAWCYETDRYCDGINKWEESALRKKPNPYFGIQEEVEFLEQPVKELETV